MANSIAGMRNMLEEQATTREKAKQEWLANMGVYIEYSDSPHDDTVVKYAIWGDKDKIIVAEIRKNGPDPYTARVYDRKFVEEMMRSLS